MGIFSRNDVGDLSVGHMTRRASVHNNGQHNRKRKKREMERGRKRKRDYSPLGELLLLIRCRDEESVDTRVFMMADLDDEFGDSQADVVQ